MIRLDSIETPKSRKTNYIYRDLHLDLEPDVVYTSNAKISGSTVESDNYHDIKAAVNEHAIKNSLTNLFNTYPGQKLLNPTYGLNLAQFLFSPISESTGQQIGNAILTGVSKFEPRIRVDNISVGIDTDNHEYNLDMTITIPKLSDAAINLSGILTESSFSFK